MDFPGWSLCQTERLLWISRGGPCVKLKDCSVQKLEVEFTDDHPEEFDLLLV